MISTNNLEKLYNEFIENDAITTKQLNEYGFNSTDINKLIDNNTIERVKRGFYSFKDINSLFEYGIKLAKEKNYNISNKIFEKCYELNPNNYKYCLQFFTICIHERKYDKVFEIYERLYNLSSENEKIDLGYYMYLLNYITDIPDKYKEKVKSLDYYSIKIPSNDERYSDVMSYNRIRSAAIRGKFSSSCKILYTITINNKGYTLQDIIEKTLLVQTINEEKKSRNHVISLVNEKKYNEVIEYLERKKEKIKLNTIEEYIIRLAEDYLIIKNTSTIPKEKNIETDNLFEAISANKFDLALRINNDFNKKRNISNEDNTINIILTDICELIKSLKKNNNKEVCQNEKTYSDNYFMSLMSSLMNNDIDSASLYLKSHLKEIGKSEYEYIITNLIKLSIIEKDIAYTAPMLELSLMNNENYKLNTSNYIQKFYYCLANNKLDEAKIYLDIINNAIKIKEESLNIDNLYKVLENHKSITNYQSNIPNFNENTKPQNNEISYEDEQDDDILDEEEEYDKEEIIRNQTDIRFIEKKHDELIERKGIIILNTMSKDRTEFILNEADKYLDMLAFPIIDEGKTRIVLKYNNNDYEDFDVKALISEAVEDYRYGSYEDSLNKQMKILETNNIKQYSANYAMIGLSYMRLHIIDKAIEYLTVANHLAKQEKNDRDFGDLLLKLKGQIDKDDIKPKVKMNENDFNNNESNNYGIENFDEINEFICDSKLDVETACNKLNISREETDIIKLIYARKFYTQGNKEKGDLFLKVVEKTKNKSKLVQKILDEIRKNKKLYKAKSSDQKVLSLTIMPTPKKSN